MSVRRDIRPFTMEQEHLDYLDGIHLMNQVTSAAADEWDTFRYILNGITDL